MSGKVITMAEAVERFVPDGSTVAMGVALEPLIPFAAGHEMIRQGRRELNLVGPISDALFDQLIGAGCVGRVTAAWVGNVSEGLGHCYRRACEQRTPRPVEVHDHTNFSIALALWAAVWNVPSLPTRTLLGSDILRTNPGLHAAAGLVHVDAVRPDVAIMHVQRADEHGRAHAWGPLGVTEEAGLAAERVVVDSGLPWTTLRAPTAMHRPANSQDGVNNSGPSPYAAAARLTTSTSMSQAIARTTNTGPVRLARMAEPAMLKATPSQVNCVANRARYAARLSGRKKVPPATTLPA